MKNMIKSIAFVFTLVLGFSLQVQAQDDATMNVTEDASANAGVVEAATEAAAPAANAEEEEVELSFVQTLKQKYIEGDVLWMTPVLICLIIGMALSIERVVYLNLATINTDKFKEEIEAALFSRFRSCRRRNRYC